MTSSDLPEEQISLALCQAQASRPVAYAGLIDLRLEGQVAA